MEIAWLLIQLLGYLLAMGLVIVFALVCVLAPPAAAGVWLYSRLTA